MADTENGTVDEVIEQGETPDEEPDYKAMYEAEKANAEKWKAMSRKNEAKYKEAAKQPKDESEEVAALRKQIDDFKSHQQRSEWVGAALSANGLNVDDAKWLTGETEDEIAESAAAFAARVAAAPKSPDMGNVGGSNQPHESSTKQEFGEFMKQLTH